MRTRAAAAAVGIVVIFAACQQPPAGQDADAAEAVRAADAAWARAFAERDLEATVAALEPSGSILAPNAPIVTGHEEARAMVTEMWAMPGMTFSWETNKVTVAQSGDLAYSAGTYDMTFDDASGNPVSDRGKFITIWRKQADGSWKVVEDIFNSDMPALGS